MSLKLTPRGLNVGLLIACIQASKQCAETCYKATCDHWDGGYWGDNSIVTELPVDAMYHIHIRRHVRAVANGLWVINLSHHPPRSMVTGRCDCSGCVCDGCLGECGEQVPDSQRLPPLRLTLGGKPHSFDIKACPTSGNAGCDGQYNTEKHVAAPIHCSLAAHMHTRLWRCSRSR